jgi:hypothetical protein
MTFMVVRTTTVAWRRLWAIDATPPGRAHPAMGADAQRRQYRSSLGPIAMSGGVRRVVSNHTRVAPGGDS